MSMSMGLPASAQLESNCASPQRDPSAPTLASPLVLFGHHDDHDHYCRHYHHHQHHLYHNCKWIHPLLLLHILLCCFHLYMSNISYCILLGFAQVRVGDPLPKLFGTFSTGTIFEEKNSMFLGGGRGGAQIAGAGREKSNTKLFFSSPGRSSLNCHRLP